MNFAIRSTNKTASFSYSYFFAIEFVLFEYEECVIFSSNFQRKPDSMFLYQMFGTSRFPQKKTPTFLSNLRFYERSYGIQLTHLVMIKRNDTAADVYHHFEQRTNKYDVCSSSFSTCFLCIGPLVLSHSLCLSLPLSSALSRSLVAFTQACKEKDTFRFASPASFRCSLSRGIQKVRWQMEEQQIIHFMLSVRLMWF